MWGQKLPGPWSQTLGKSWSEGMSQMHRGKHRGQMERKHTGFEDLLSNLWDLWSCPDFTSTTLFYLANFLILGATCSVLSTKLLLHKWFQLVFCHLKLTFLPGAENSGNCATSFWAGHCNTKDLTKILREEKWEAALVCAVNEELVSLKPCDWKKMLFPKGRRKKPWRPQ